MKATKATSRKRIHLGIRKKISGTSTIPRLNVYRSNKQIYCQVIDDLSGTTLASASSRENGMGGKDKKEVAKAVGKAVAERALSANISRVKFDRGGYPYHGRVKALAEGAREGGLNI